MAKVETVKLVGGTRDGETWDVFGFQKSLFLMKKISLEEDQALVVDGVIKRKSPEEVYVRQKDGTFLFDHEVHY